MSRKGDIADEIRYFRKRVIEDTIRVFCGYKFGVLLKIAASWGSERVSPYLEEVKIM
jgi:hypothetical protein